MKSLVSFFLIIIGLCVTIHGYSQTINYTYGYDASGNRISRNAIYLRSAHITSDTLSIIKAKQSEAIKEMIDNRQITIYPNPTKGLLTVDIPLNEGDIARISLYDIQGRVILDLKNVGSTTELDLSGQPSAIYLLRIFINNKPMTWKIIKQD